MYNYKKTTGQNQIFKSVLFFIKSLERHIVELYDLEIIDINQYITHTETANELINMVLHCYNDNNSYNIAILNTNESIIETNDHLNTIYTSCLELIANVGVPDMISFINVFSERIELLENLEQFDFYNLSCLIISLNICKQYKDEVSISVLENINIFPFGKVIVMRIGNIKIEYVPNYDNTNLLLKSCKIVSKYLTILKSKLLINSNNYSNEKKQYILKLFKCYPQIYCFCFNSFFDIANEYFDLYIKIKHNFETYMTDIINCNKCDIFKEILVLSCGDTDDLHHSGILLNLMKTSQSKKIIDLIFKFLPHKIKKEVNIYSYMVPLKHDTIRHITIEDRIAIKPDIPNNVKNVIMDKYHNSNDETGKSQMLIEALLNFPWKPKNIDNNCATRDRKYIREHVSNVKKLLDENVYGHQELKKCMLDLITKWAYTNDNKGDVIGLCGPPGVGKTLIAKSLGKALNLPLEIINLGGMSDSSDLVGHNFTYQNSQYGSIIRAAIKMGKWKNILYFDELDKISLKNNISEIYNILIHLTDPFSEFTDRFFPSTINFDMSGTLFIFSYNDRHKIDRILLDRIHEISISAYDNCDKISLTKTFFNKELNLSLSDEIIEYVIENYTVEAGVRELKRCLEKIHTRSVYEYIFSEHDDIINIDVNKIQQYLGKPLFAKTSIKSTNIGCLVGLYVSSLGIGGIMSISVGYSAGNKLITTGNQKKIMEESIHCAVTFCNYYCKLVEPLKGLHFHVSDFSVPKDGPSAGLAFGLCLFSLINNYRIKKNIAVTGELDIHGNVIEVGRVNEKIKAAIKNNIEIVIIPKNNIVDVDKIKNIEKIKIIQINHITECFDVVFEKN